MLFTYVTLSSLAAIARAHMVMSNPVPYGADSLNNSPLFGDGSDFPCKQRSGVYDVGSASNVYKQGSTQTLEFKGSAVHGGGSCQLSVTKDKNPTKDSVWKVIKSIEGGCPAQGQAGNLPADPNGSGAGKYEFTIPTELAAGDYTLAWTWFNKVGNREMYMNCAPMQVTGSGGSSSFMDSLPDMFVANIGNQCGTKSDTDVLFPDPGKDVVKMNGATDAFDTPTGTCPKATGGGGSNGGATDTPAQPTYPAGQPSNGQSEAPATTAQPSAPAPSATAPSVPGGVFITVSQPDAGSPQPTATVAPAPEQPTTQQPAPSSPATSPGNGSDSGSGSGGFATGTACTSEGEWNCVGGTSFQRCASGAWSALQDVASGSQCTPGQSSELALAVKRGTYAMRRGLRFRG